MTPKEIIMRLRQIEELALNPRTANSELPDDWLTADKIIISGNELSTSTKSKE